jgi:hypothetical protein
MLITLYTPIGIVYQKFEITENDITYCDLIKYIHLPKNELYDELDKSKIIYDRVFVKTIINLFNYKNSEKINLDDEILCDSNEFTIVFSYEYYYHNHRYGYGYKKIKNNIKNCNNIFEEINNYPFQIIFIENNNENYYEICKLAVQRCGGYTLQCIKNQTYEICKLAVKKNGHVLQYVKPELMTEEICKLAVQQYCYSLEFVKEELMTDEIVKLALSEIGLSLQYVKPELMTDEICKLAVQKDGWALQFVKSELITDEICKLAVQKNGDSLEFVKPEFMTEEICKLAVKQNGWALEYVKPEFMTEEICKLASANKNNFEFYYLA